MPEAWLLFVSKPTGYELRERDGELPSLGDRLEEGDLRLEITKLGPSPLPGDTRVCAFTQPLA